MALAPRSGRDKPAVALTGDEIQGLLTEAHSGQTELLTFDFSRCTFWFLVLMLVSGAPASRLFGATLRHIYVEGGSWWLRIGNATTRIPSVVEELGLLGYLARLRHQGEMSLFPALARQDCLQMLSRVLSGRRVESACGRPGGYKLQDIRMTHKDQSLVVAALSALHSAVGFLE